MQLLFVPSESTSSYFDCLRGYLDAHGCPVAFYSDKRSVFRMNRDAKAVRVRTFELCSKQEVSILWDVIGAHYLATDDAPQNPVRRWLAQ